MSGMQLGWGEPLSEEGRQQIKRLGGFCHRQPSTVPAGGQTPMGQQQMIRMSGFGLCQRELCPLWLADPGVCLDRAVALDQAARVADAAKHYPLSFQAKNLVPKDGA